MTHTETRISNERLAEMLAGLEDATPGPWNRRRVGHQWAVEDRHTRYIAMMQNSVDERQGNAAHIARCAPDTIRAMILELQALRTPVEADHIADAGKMVEAQPIHALPMQPYDLQGNPSPSDGEVSEVWQDIATAPKDGTVFLAVASDAQTPKARPAWWDGEAWVRIWKSEDFVQDGPRRWWPSHWQPMPSFSLQSKRGQP